MIIFSKKALLIFLCISINALMSMHPELTHTFLSAHKSSTPQSTHHTFEELNSMDTPISMHFPMHCVEPWFSFIKKGIKPVEGRKNSAKYHALKEGDLIQFINEHQESFLAHITKIEKYHTLQEYLSAVTIQKALPTIQTFKEGIAIYTQWSTFEEIAELDHQYGSGFLGIFVNPLE